MHVCRFVTPIGPHLGLIVDDHAYDLTLIDPGRFGSLTHFLAWSAGITSLAEALMTVIAHHRPLPGDLSHLPWLKPVDEQEIWAAGVTFLRSRIAREQESLSSDLYSRVYTAARPELFFKATPSRTVGPGEPVRVRADSNWTVPEPELALVLNPRLEIVGFTVGNDMSARDIEGENTLYLPQAKIYRQCCALGPTIRLAGTGIDPTALTIRLRIERSGEPIFEGSTRTDQMARSFNELINYLGRDNEFPQGVVLLTGTGIVPPEDCMLMDGDVITIEIEEIGTLRNPVVKG
jgi:2-dehydro-3-deoxy-D-arabinonate dehydratase